LKVDLPLPIIVLTTIQLLEPATVFAAPAADTASKGDVMKYLHHSALPLIAAAFTLSFNAFAQSQPTPMAREKTQHVEANITAIDKDTRTLTLKGQKETVKIVAGPEVRNFDQMKVGDKVRVTYHQALAAEIKKNSAKVKGEAKANTSEANLVYRAPAGSQPAAGVGRAVSSTVKIKSVNAKANTVSFTHDNEFVTMSVDSPEGRRFIRTLLPGDEVEVSYVEALAVEVTPVK
jgi:hypothetical protein